MLAATTEDTLLTQLKTVVDQTSEQLQWGNLTLWEAVELIDQTRVQAEKLIPEQMGLNQRIYGSRLRRLFEQFVVPRQLTSRTNQHEPSQYSVCNVVENIMREVSRVSVSHAFVKNHSGDLIFSSELEQGTTVTVNLPAAP